MIVPRVELAPGYTVSRVIHGTWQLSAGHRERPVDRGAAVDGLLRLAEAGFTTFDSADIYTGAEELLGDLVRAWGRRGGDGPRRDLQIHTKLVPDRGALARVDRAYLEAVVDRSLRRLGVERLDLVQLHWWDYGVPGWVEAAGVLDDLRRAGKVRLVGATNFDVAHLSEILDAGVPVVSHQVQYSVVDRRPEHGMVALARERGLALLAYGTLAGGFLTERWLGAGPREPSPANRSLIKYRLILDELGPWTVFQELLSVLREIAQRRGAGLATVALAWTLGRPGVAAAIVGATGGRHLEATLRAAELRLEVEELEAIDRVVGRGSGPSGDTYDLEREPGSAHAAIMRYDLNQV